MFLATSAVGSSTDIIAFLLLILLLGSNCSGKLKIPRGVCSGRSLQMVHETFLSVESYRMGICNSYIKKP